VFEVPNQISSNEHLTLERSKYKLLPGALPKTDSYSGLMVPMINTAEEAKSVVTYSKFPPLGLRGQGSAFPAIGHGLTTPEYMKTANETLLTILQIESKEGVENVDAIAAVPGVGESFFTSLSYASEPRPSLVPF
jgi:hypothetical protein